MTDWHFFSKLNSWSIFKHEKKEKWIVPFDLQWCTMWKKNNSTQYKLHGIGQWSKNVIKYVWMIVYINMFVKIYFFPTCIFIKNILVFVNDFKCVWFFFNLHFFSIIFTKPMYHVYMYDILDIKASCFSLVVEKWVE